MARSCLIVVLILLSSAGPAAAQPATWTGAITNSWNIAGNWNPAGVPNSPVRTITFDATAAGFAVNIAASVTAGSLTFDNLAAGQNYNLTSSANQTLTLALATDILVTDAVAAPQTINLANVVTGSLLFTGTSTNSLLIRNQTTSLATPWLVIGPNTRIAAVDTGGVFFDGNGHTLVSGNIVVAPAGLTKEGGGVLTLSGINSFSGLTRLNGGRLALDYSTTANSKLPTGALLSTGGELSLLANATTGWIENISGTSLNAGHTIFRLNTNFGALADIELNLGAISRLPTATADFDRDTGGAFSTSSGNVNGILSGALTSDIGAGWATNSAGSIIPLPLASYSTTFAAGTNVNMTADATIGTVSINSLRFGASGVTLTISGSLTVQSGGILQSTSGGGTTIQGGDLLTPAGQPLLVHTYAGLPLTISSRIDTADGLVKTGIGTLVLSGNNTTLTGAIDVNRGNLTITTSVAVNSASALRFNDIRGDRDQVFTVETTGDINTIITRPIQLGLDSALFGTRFSTGANLNSRVTLSGVISSAAGAVTPLKIGVTNSGPNNGFNLTGTNTFSGPVTLEAGFLGIDNNASLGNAANTLILSVGGQTVGGLEFLNSSVTLSRPVQLAFNTRVLSNATDVNTISGVIDGAGTLVKAGTGTLVLSGANTWTGTLNIDAGTVRVAAAANLGAGTSSIGVGGTLAFTENLAYGRPFSLGLFDGGPSTGTFDVATGKTLNLTGSITNRSGASGTLVKTGLGTLSLASTTSSYSGGTIVQQGTVLTATNAGLGASAGPVTVEPLGNLTFFGSTSTSRIFNLTSGVLEAQAGVTLDLIGATVGGGFLRGAGTYSLSFGTTLTGTTTFTSTTMNVIGSSSAANFTNNGAITVNSGQTFAMNYATNASAGRMTINGTANVSDFVSNGQINVPTGGLLSNAASPSGIVLGGGSTTFVGTPAVMGGIINVGTQPLLVRGGLLVNNGAIGNSTGNGQVIVDYGGFAKGGGFYDTLPITINGGRFSPGNSPGRVTVGSVNMTPGGIYDFEINNATGLAGPTGTTNLSGWDLTIVSNQINPTLSNLTVSATSATPFTINLVTLTNPSPPDVPGQMANFNPNMPFQWLAFDVNTAGSVVNWDPSAIVVNTSQFMNTFNGTFSLVRDTGNPFQFYISYTPVPEPATVLAVAFGGLIVGGAIRRRIR